MKNKVTVTWMDGKIEIYHDVSYQIENGVLMINQSRDREGLPLPNQRKLHLPLASIRTITVDQRMP